MASVAVTFRERSRARYAVGPLLLAACGLSTTAGLPSPNVPGAILTVFANCTSSQQTFGMDHDHSSIPSLAWPAI